MEHRFSLDVDGVKLIGYIDHVDKLESGNLSIIDYKTNQEPFTAEYVEKDLQLTLYQMAAEQTWRLPVEKLTLYHLRTNTACSCLPRDEYRIRAARDLIIDTADNINAGRFPATENQYCPCDFPEYCPLYRREALANASTAPRQAYLPGLTPNAGEGE
jgi:putative RecB family exonuclease